MYKDEKVGLLCSNLPNGMRSLTQEEELSFNGGYWIVVGGVLIFVGAVGLGAYNSYNRTIENPPLYARNAPKRTVSLGMKK